MMLASLDSRLGIPGCFHFWFFTHHLDMKQQVISYPRRSDCPGSFHSPASLGTSFKLARSFGEETSRLVARQNDSLLRQTFYATTESPTETISWLQPPMFDFQGT